MPRILVPLVALLVGAGSLAPVAAAAPRFATPVTLSRTSLHNDEGPSVAVAADRVAVAWSQASASGRQDVLVRRGTIAGEFRPAQRVGTGQSTSVSLHASGRSAIAWSDYKRRSTVLRVAVARAGHRFGAAQALATDRGRVFDAQVLSAGPRDVVVWTYRIGRTDQTAARMAIADRSGRFGRPVTLAKMSRYGESVRAVAAADGSVTLSYLVPGEDDTAQYVVATLAPGATAVGSVTPVSYWPNFAHGPGGNALGFQDDRFSLYASSLVQGVPTAAETVASAPPNTPDTQRLAGPELALPGSGLPPIAAWDNETYSYHDEDEFLVAGTILAAARAPDGTWPNPLQLSRPGTLASDPDAAATTHDSVVAWATGHFPRYRLAYAAQSPSAPFGSQGVISADRAIRPPVLAASEQAVVAVWTSNQQRTTDRDHAREAIRIAILCDAN